MKTLFSMTAGHPLISLLVTILVIVVMIKITRLVFRLALLGAIIGMIMIVFFGTPPQEVLNQGGKFVSLSISYLNDKIKPVINDGLKNTRVIKGANGTVEIAGDQFEIGETPGGKFVFSIKPLHLSLSQDNLAKFLGQGEIQKLLKSAQDKNQPATTNNL